jgi:crotonobetainyl-CoA:carnitine CoA-transferase CaiB-like acyl-CoA transferase
VSGALAGIRVIEFGRFIAAPYCCQLLADAGADVIKVEPITGDDARRNGEKYAESEAQQFLNKNRNKRSIACDLSDATVVSALMALIKKTDVLVANFRPGQAEKLGLDYQSLKAINPNMIYAENSGFGPKGPLAESAGMDMALQGFSGLAPLTPNGPMPLMDPVIDYSAAMLMAWGISTALFHRERTGNGQKLDVSLLQASLVLQNNHINAVANHDKRRQEFILYLKSAFAEGATWEDVLARQSQSSSLGATGAYYGFFRTSNQVLCLGAGGSIVQKRLLNVLELTDPLLEEDGIQPTDIGLHVHKQRILVEEKLSAHPIEYWMPLLSEANVPASHVNLKAQLLEDEQVLANGYVSQFKHPIVGEVTVVSPPVNFSETKLEILTPSPVLGQHTADILSEAGLPHKTIEELISKGKIVCPVER